LPTFSNLDERAEQIGGWGSNRSLFWGIGKLVGTMVVFVLFLAYEAAVAERACEESATRKIVRFGEKT
jgi:hypothetical protein